MRRSNIEYHQPYLQWCQLQKWNIVSNRTQNSFDNGLVRLPEKIQNTIANNDIVIMDFL